MEKRNKKILFEFLYILLIFLVIGFMIFLVIFLRSNSSQCMINPMNYYEEKQNAKCFCFHYGEIVSRETEKYKYPNVVINFTNVKGGLK